MFLQHFTELEPRRHVLPLFGSLGRAMSATHVNAFPAGLNTSSYSNPTSLTDLSISPPLSPGESHSLFPSPPSYMPAANRRQRRASLVSVDMMHLEPANDPALMSQSEIGFGKIQTYTKLEKLGEVRHTTVFVFH